jgi:hypothetical protein
MRKDINKYIQNWNENNPDHAIPLKEKQNEQPKKDESWKEAAWYKEQYQAQTPQKESPRQGQPPQ